MSRSSFLSIGPWTIGGMIVFVLLLLIWVIAPIFGGSGGGLSGSTYGRSPDGYGAWYAYMNDAGTPVARWQKPFNQLTTRSHVVLVQVSPRGYLDAPSADEQAWLQRGNRLIRVGLRGRVTQATFSDTVESDYGAIALDTRRRRVNLPGEAVEILGDDDGAIAWRQVYGKGDFIAIVPPFIAANAYQDASGNYAFLADLVNQDRYERWIDEYIHGYRETQDVIDNVASSWTAYLTKTPLLIALMQVSLLTLIALVVNNRRHRPPVALQDPEPNSSQAYIEALASVLYKAKSANFVVETIGREEQRRVQQALGLGVEPVDPDRLLQAWHQQTGHSTTALNQVMQPYWKPTSMSQAQLLRWIKAVQQIHRQLDEAFGTFRRNGTTPPDGHSQSPTQNLRQVATGESSR